MIDRLSTTAAIAVRQAGAYTDLILSDLDISARVVRGRLLWGALAVAAAHLCALMGCALVIAVSWDSPYRLWVIGGLFVGFLVAAAAAIWRIGVVNAGSPGVLAQTAREWAKDRQLLEQLLAQQRAEAR